MAAELYGTMARLLAQLRRYDSPCPPRMVSPQHAACTARALAACNRPTSPPPQPNPHPCQLTQYPSLTLWQAGSIGGRRMAATTASRTAIERHPVRVCGSRAGHCLQASARHSLAGSRTFWALRAPPPLKGLRSGRRSRWLYVGGERGPVARYRSMIGSARLAPCVMCGPRDVKGPSI